MLLTTGDDKGVGMFMLAGDQAVVGELGKR